MATARPMPESPPVMIAARLSSLPQPLGRVLAMVRLGRHLGRVAGRLLLLLGLGRRRAGVFGVSGGQAAHFPQVHGKQAGAAPDRDTQLLLTQLPLVEMLCRKKHRAWNRHHWSAVDA
jgi:hypothetical protein